MIAPRSDDGSERQGCSSSDKTEAAGPDGHGPPGPPMLDLEALFNGDGDNAVVDEADLVPARMLNEFAYCPRLAYLEWVQGEFRDNLDTREGIRELANRNIPVCHFSFGGWFNAITTGMSHKNVELRMAQFRTASDPRAALTVARGFIAAKMKNCRTLLRRHADEKYKPELDRLADYIQRADRVESLESLMGMEGMAAKVYFGGFARLIRGGEEFQLAGRNRRPPTDPVNALLSFVYALLVKELTITLQAVGFDPHLGFLHQPRYGRPSLALDLAEEFRPLVGDSVVLTLINNEEVSPKSFVKRAGSVALTDNGRKAVIAGFERRLETEITHPIFGYKISYRRVFEVQARLLSRVLLGELEEYPGFCTR